MLRSMNSSLNVPNESRTPNHKRLLKVSPLGGIPAYGGGVELGDL